MVYAGAIVIGLVIAIGIATILPAYYQKQPAAQHIISQPIAILSFSIINDTAIPKWCNDLSSLLKKQDLEAIVFVTGKVATQYPGCVQNISINNSQTVDIGSQTFDYVRLTSVLDYKKALEEVRNGKQALDDAGNINSTVFRAPYGSTDQNIYSLLTRSGIVADFSYNNQYNKYQAGQFIKYDLIAYNGSSYSTKKQNMLSSLSSAKLPVLINFDNSTPVDQIENIVSDIKSQNKDIHFINGSELTGMNLTVRKKV